MLKLFSFWLVLISLKSNGQIPITLDTIRSDYVIIHPDYKLIIKNPTGWEHYANYEYSKDTLILYSGSRWNFKNRGRTELTLNGIRLIGHGRYKIKGDKIKLLAAKELRKGIIWKKWYSQKIIKITPDYMILESNLNNKKIRHVYLKN